MRRLSCMHAASGHNFETNLPSEMTTKKLAARAAEIVSRRRMLSDLNCSRMQTQNRKIPKVGRTYILQAKFSNCFFAVSLACANATTDGATCFPKQLHCQAGVCHSKVEITITQGKRSIATGYKGVADSNMLFA